MVGRREDSYVPTAKSETGPVAGLTYERLISRKRDRYSIKLDLLYTKQNFYCYGERSNSLGGTTIDDTYFNFSGIKVPVMFQYSITGEGLCLTLMQVLLTSSSLVRTIFIQPRLRIYFMK